MSTQKTKGIPVMNVPVYGTDNVSQFAVSLLLEVCSHIGHHSDSVYAGEWAEQRRLVLLALSDDRGIRQRLQVSSDLAVSV